MSFQKMKILLMLLLCVAVSALRKIIYRIVEEKTWDEAKAYCRRRHTDLLTIRDQAENEMITDKGWIGLYREMVQTKCKWSSGHDNNNFCKWAAGNPFIFTKETELKNTADLKA